jgi:hypothetical protein
LQDQFHLATPLGVCKERSHRILEITGLTI